VRVVRQFKGEAKMFGKTDVGAVKAAVDRADSGEKTNDPDIWVVPEEGQHGVWFLPPLQGESVPWLKYAMHYNLSAAAVCLSSFNETCPICLENQKLYKAGQTGDMVAAGISAEIYKRESYLFNIIPWLTWEALPQPISLPTGLVVTCKAVFKAPSGDKVPKNLTATKPLIYRGGQKVQRQLASAMPFNGDVTDPAGGNIIFVSKVKQTGKNGKVYYETLLQPFPQKAALDAALVALAQTGMHNLREHLLKQKKTPAEMKALVDAKIAEAQAGQGGSASAPQSVYGGSPVAAQNAPMAVPPPPMTISKPDTVTAAVPTVGGDPLASFEATVLQK